MLSLKENFSNITKEVVSNNKLSNKLNKILKENFHNNNEYDEEDNTNMIFFVFIITVIFYLLAIYYLINKWKYLDDWCKIISVTLLVTGELGGPITTLILIYFNLYKKK